MDSRISESRADDCNQGSKLLLLFMPLSTLGQPPPNAPLFYWLSFKRNSNHTPNHTFEENGYEILYGYKKTQGLGLLLFAQPPNWELVDTCYLMDEP